jgi:hypothetical protein
MIELVTKQDLQAAIDTQTRRLTVRLGGIVADGFGVMGAAMGMFAFFFGCTEPVFDHRRPIVKQGSRPPARRRERE